MTVSVQATLLDTPADEAVQPGPASVAWRIHRERIMLLSWGRAIALQFAHPQVAAGVDQHSAFGAPRENRARLHRTVQAMLNLTFGDREHAERTWARIDGIHGYVNGHLEESAGAHQVGEPYSARMPELLLWVYATILDSSLIVFERYVGPLTTAECDQYCTEARMAGPLLGLPAEMIPATRAELERYMQDMYATRQVAVGETGRRLLRRLLTARPLPLVPAPVLTSVHLPTVGLLPPAIRADYGLRWSERHERALAASAAACRRLLPFVPPVARYWPIARAAYRRAGG